MQKLRPLHIGLMAGTLLLGFLSLQALAWHRSLQRRKAECERVAALGCALAMYQDGHMLSALPFSLSDLHLAEYLPEFSPRLAPYHTLVYLGRGRLATSMSGDDVILASSPDLRPRDGATYYVNGRVTAWDRPPKDLLDAIRAHEGARTQLARPTPYTAGLPALSAATFEVEGYDRETGNQYLCGRYVFRLDTARDPHGGEQYSCAAGRDAYGDLVGSIVGSFQSRPPNGGSEPSQPGSLGASYTLVLGGDVYAFTTADLAPEGKTPIRYRIWRLFECYRFASVERTRVHSDE